jgi:hypothetical protein
MAVMEQIRRQIPFEELDYQTLLNCLRDYSRPRDKVSDLLKSRAIIRVKKGLYIFGPEFSRGPYSRELLANLIYGPSYVSLDYALGYYGLIPERVETMTSVTCGKNRTFSTPVGRFTYWAVPLPYYRLGIDLVRLDERRSFLLATREKALADKIFRDRGSGIGTRSELKTYLLDNLRIDPGELSRLDIDRLQKISQYCRSRRVRLLVPFLLKQKAAPS